MTQAVTRFPGSQPFSHPVVTAAPAARPAAPRPSAALTWTFLLWLIVLLDPQWWVASFGPTIVLKLPTVLIAILFIVAVLKAPSRLLAPLLVFAVYVVFSELTAYNRLVGINTTKDVLIYYAIALITLTLVRTAQGAVRIVLWAMLYQFLWWLVLGVRNGLVPWHPTLNNYDGYGPLMSLGLGCTFYIGMATKERKLRWLAFAAAGGCIFGLVSTFARGAMLSGAAVGLWLWVRSRHKRKMTMAAIAAGVVVLVAGSLYLRPIRHLDQSGGATIVYGNIWQEMATMFDPANDDTHIDRDVIWGVALGIYREHPVFGVGPHNFGPYAADHVRPGTVGGQYTNNPRMLFDKALHNTYYQILCEFGTVGMIIFIWMLWDFAKRNRALRKPERIQAWAERTGGRLDLRYVSLALEAGMVAWMTSAYFYNQIFEVPWLYTLLTINALLFHVTRPQRAQATPRRAP